MNEQIKELALQVEAQYCDLSDASIFKRLGLTEAVVFRLTDLEKFANLVAAQERKAWEHKFARLQNLMDIREIQPNKPCCLAARADEREECAKLCDGLADTHEKLSQWSSHKTADTLAQAIRARGTI